MMITLNKAIEMGMKVKIRHHRLFDVGVIIAMNDNGPVIDNVLTRGEYINAQKNGEMREVRKTQKFSKYKNLNDVPYGEAVSPTGGFTTVEVFLPEGKRFFGKYNFPKRAPFNRKVGVMRALNRALGGKYI